VGFFVAGSSNEGINGLYARTDSVPSVLAGAHRRFSLLYKHLDSGWHMGLGAAARGGAAQVHEWVIIDPVGRDRLANDENTLIPAAGDKWKHVHRAPPSEERREEPSNGDGNGDGDSDSDEDEETRENGGGGGSADGIPPPAAMPASGTQVKPTAGDNADELPWQLIAILGEDMLHNLASHKRYHDSLVRAALNCRPPPPPPGTSAELAPPPEAVTAAARVDADDAGKRGRHADAAALYGEEIRALDFIAAAPEEGGAGAGAGAEAGAETRVAWTRALLGLRRAEALRRAQLLDAARDQLSDVLGSHPLYLDALFQSALTK
jgi:hypothetical protein